MSDQLAAEPSEIQFIDIISFLRRRIIPLAAIFVLGMVLAASYILTRPTLFKTQLDVVVGRIMFFGAAQPIEALDQTIQRVTPDAPDFEKDKTLQITNVRNTNILRITTTAGDEQHSRQKAESTAQKILQIHAELLGQKQNDFVKYLKSVQLENKELMELIDAASSSNASHIAAEGVTVELPYSGLLIKGLAAGFFISIFLAISFCLLLEALNRD